jgi:AraC family carnitine catabolism transcriptional activator
MSQDFYFLLMPGFSAIGFISAHRTAAGGQPLSRRAVPLARAERRRRRGAGEQWHVGQRRRGAGAAEKGATLLVVAGFEPLQFATPALEHWLRRLDHDGVTLGAIDTGACILAEAGLLDGHRLTLHWEAIDAFKESYPS